MSETLVQVVRKKHNFENISRKKLLQYLQELIKVTRYVKIIDTEMNGSFIEYDIKRSLTDIKNDLKNYH